jgi:hypothetical protein
MKVCCYLLCLRCQIATYNIVYRMEYGTVLQVLIFPEGTCTNRSCLITFKPGAFYPGVPIQPVCIRYPNKLDTVTWTWEGPGA